MNVFNNISNLLAAARNNDVPIIHAISEHSSWSASPSGKERFGRSGQKESLSYCEPGSWGAEIYPPFQPAAKEKVITKHRYSAFVHTNLELLLRTANIHHLLIAGLYTNVCIDSTARDGYMRDFNVTVPEDCVASDNDDKHRYALKLLEGTFAEVTNSYSLIKQWNSKQHNIE